MRDNSDLTIQNGFADADSTSGSALVPINPGIFPYGGLKEQKRKPIPWVARLKFGNDSNTRVFESIHGDHYVS